MLGRYFTKFLQLASLGQVASMIEALIDVFTTLLGRHLALLKAQFVLQSQAVVFTMAQCHYHR